MAPIFRARPLGWPVVAVEGNRLVVRQVQV